ncbi:hypothetical protein FB565_000085 [Actinoplanes lutulentus]|uniref:hypothetical protein n=1 Tax=Actinoplanes lutulentus TaxID=1287878 RepID=UPI000DBA3EDF|nr:hypothetical protein [Actinoplanes lutulentus]MBB2940381.1 hypothetical protein [Actinoplanes lutulentus]
MSFDLMLVDPDTAPTSEQIYQRLDSDEPEALLSNRMRAAIDECASRWPGSDQADSPWASWPLADETGPSVIEINIQHEFADDMVPTLIEIAGRHGIVLYDPQQDELHLPARLLPRD